MNYAYVRFKWQKQICVALRLYKERRAVRQTQKRAEASVEAGAGGKSRRQRDYRADGLRAAACRGIHIFERAQRLFRGGGRRGISRRADGGLRERGKSRKVRGGLRKGYCDRAFPVFGVGAAYTQGAFRLRRAPSGARAVRRRRGA